MSATIYPVKILTALHAVMGAVGYVQKKGENKFHNYKYAGEANLLEVLRPAMVEHGLMLIPSARTRTDIDQFGNTAVEIEYTLAHKDGDVWPEKIIAMGMGNDKNKSGGVGDKGLYKALTGANKYLLFKLFQIETGDDPEKDSDHDKDGTPVKTPTAAPAKPAEVDKVKNAPGVSEAKIWVREHIRELNGCGDPDNLMEIITGAKARYVKICGVYPALWTGPDGTGLRGEALKMATAYECRPAFDKFIKEVEAAAPALNQKEAAE